MNFLTRNRKQALIVSTGIMAITGIGGTFAYAGIPAADGTVRACYAKSSSIIAGVPVNKGDVRIVD